MKLRSIGWLVVVSLTLSRTTSGQDFQDLDFESATLVPVPGNAYGSIQFASAFPGWTQTIVGGLLGTNALYNNLFLDSAGIGIFDQNSSFLSSDVIEGNYTAILESGLGYTQTGLVPSDVILSQTGLVPFWTKSLQFKANNWFDSSGAFAVMLGGQTLSLTVLGSGPNYTLYGAEVSQWANQTAQLSFTVFGETPHVNNEIFFLDDIQFSPSSVPEPNTLCLIALGALLFGLRRIKLIQY
ncbi:MAG TPA: PEP-CTERM sorting domain-containing protein [Verrucomicrobiae bacterium]|nr:PEP-CTERM sorting domain-containing protein [Verrucomicrobiae bacterium]